jgi:hypothetical protein
MIESIINRDQCGREPTVAEYIDEQIAVTQQKIDALRALRGALSSSFLQRGCSVIADVVKSTLL